MGLGGSGSETGVVVGFVGIPLTRHNQELGRAVAGMILASFLKVDLTYSTSRYGQGLIVKQYRSGERISVTAEITANHKGYFEFRLCPQVTRASTVFSSS